MCVGILNCCAVVSIHQFCLKKVIIPVPVWRLYLIPESMMAMFVDVLQRLHTLPKSGKKGERLKKCQFCFLNQTSKNFLARGLPSSILYFLIISIQGYRLPEKLPIMILRFIFLKRNVQNYDNVC